jgi:hypothetical protein
MKRARESQPIRVRVDLEGALPDDVFSTEFLRELIAAAREWKAKQKAEKAA